MVLGQGHSKGGACGLAAVGSKVQGAVKWVAKEIVRMTKIYFLLLTNFKSFGQIGGKSINILSCNLKNLSHVSVKLDAVKCCMKLLQYYKI
jgi:hypothetical protein